MILGIGTDLANIDRIQGVLDRFGDRFRNRVFTPTEQARAERTQVPAATYAKRWAAKEACSKALGTGFRRGVFWRDIGVINLPTGKPTLHLTGCPIIPTSTYEIAIVDGVMASAPLLVDTQAMPASPKKVTKPRMLPVTRASRNRANKHRPTSMICPTILPRPTSNSSWQSFRIDTKAGLKRRPRQWWNASMRYGNWQCHPERA